MEIKVEEIDGRINALARQRNEALDKCVVLEGRLMVLQSENAVLKETIQALEGEKNG
jgi:hypothetical protein